MSLKDKIFFSLFKSDKLTETYLLIKKYLYTNITINETLRFCTL